MFRGEKRGPIGSLIAVAIMCALAVTASAQTGTISGTVKAKGGEPLAYANVILVGTNMGAMSLADGKFTIAGVPAGTYTIKAMMMGYKAIEKPNVRVSGGELASINFAMEETIVKRTQTITVTGTKAMVDVGSSQVTASVTGKQLNEMPVDDVLEAVALKAGIVKQGDQMFVRGGRSNEVQIQIDGVPVDDPLGGSTVGVGMLGTSGSEVITGGMDSEYGNAMSAIINISTKEGGRRFGGEVRYFTDDFGRQDKTYTNFDRISLGFGGPTWWKSFRYYFSGEASFTDQENTTIEPRPEHKITNWLKFRNRQRQSYNLQTKISYHHGRIKVTGETILTQSRRDAYQNNWNISGFVEKVYIYQGVGYLIPPDPDNPDQLEIMQFTRLRNIPHGRWAELSPDQQEITLKIRSVQVQEIIRNDQTGLQELRIYDNFRVADIGGRLVIWDEAVLANDGSTVLYHKPWVLFEGFQFPNSDYSPFVRDPNGADSAFVSFNSATRTPEIRSNNIHFKINFNHNITSKLLYSIKLSRLRLNTISAVVDENGDQKSPEEYASAGLPVTLPNGRRLEGGITQAQWYTDSDRAYFVTAYDFPGYSNQTTVQYLIKADLTSEQVKGHRMKTGVQFIYNSLSDDERAFPAQRRFNTTTGLFQQGLNVNIYRNFNPEGAFYAQDKWEYEGMVVNGGMRFEWFDVGNNNEINISSAEIDPTVDEFKWNLSPRLGFAFPITDRDKFFFHYGRFTQWPSRVFLFRTQDVVGSTGTLGNPNLEPELTVSYQAGISHQFSDDIAGNFIVFNKDIYGLISSARVTDDSTGLQGFRYINRTYASSRGMEISLEKRLTRRIGFEIYYTYSFADGVASDADFGRSAEGLTHLPTQEQPLSWDQRHTFNVTLRLVDRNKWGVTSIYQYGSGMPWTPVDRFARLADPTWENSRRLEPSHKLSVQGRKHFNMYGRELTMFFEGRNLLDADVLLPNGVRPFASPGMLFAQMDGGSYLTETGRYGGAYLQDTDDDGLDNFNPVFDPTIWEQHRIWRLGIGFEF